jgi:hypothetical protein
LLIQGINRMLKHESFIISISYGNFTESVGGTDKVILEHKIMLDSIGISHIHLFSYNIKLPKIKYSFKQWGIIIDGKVINQVFAFQEIVQIVEHLIRSHKKLMEFHIHHLLNLNINQVAGILNNFKVPIKFYIHDYYTVCIQHNLLKNDIDYCGLGSPYADKCNGCKYSKNAKEHFTIIENFLGEFENRLLFIAPSDIAKEIWTSAFDKYSNKVVVIKHQLMKGVYYGNSNQLTQKKSIKIAYVGAQAYHKGWNQWRNISKKINELKLNYELYHFGKSSDRISFIKKIPVFFKDNNINAMIEALRLNSIDIVLLWSIVPETYSYTYYECTAANTFIITNKNSGNIAYMVNSRKNGIVLDDEKQLLKLLCNENHLRELLNQFKNSKKYGPLTLYENNEITNLITKNGLMKNEVTNIKKENWALNIKRSFLTYIFRVYNKLEKLYFK